MGLITENCASSLRFIGFFGEIPNIKRFRDLSALCLGTGEFQYD